MAVGPDFSSAITSGLFSSAAFGPIAASPPHTTFGQLGMSADVLSGTNTMSSHPYSLSPIGERKVMDHTSLLTLSKLEPTASNPEMELPAILMRKLPRNTSLDVLRTMLLFAVDMVDVNFVESEYADDAGYSSAVARFRSVAGAHEARDKLHGKTISNDANLMVELYPGLGFPAGRRNTVDGASLRHASSSASSAGSSGGQQNQNQNQGRQSSRFNGTFQSLDRMSPPNGSFGGDKFPSPESNAQIQSLFSPQSSLANATMSSKSIINDDPGDETGQLLNDPVAFAKNGETSQSPFARRTTNPQIPVSRFAGLSLLSTTNSSSAMTSPQSGFISPRSSTTTMQSSNSSFSPNGMTALPGLGNGNNYPGSPHFQRHPPPNPADQNPPCNTLYVGNLPVDTSEDELKAMFSKQRGYKRLCFRTKQNGPMCFVEFEDTSFATKALNELYGHPLHNSVKGGIRLSFSKNPLGVRSGQQTSNGLQSPMNTQVGMQGMGGSAGVPPGFTTATGPPPGLTAPPGLAPSHPPTHAPNHMGMNGGPPLMNGAVNFGMYNSGAFGMGANGYGPPMRQPMATTMAGGNFQGMGGDYANYRGR